MATTSPTNPPLLFPNSEQVLVTVQTGQSLQREVNGFMTHFVGGDTVLVPANEVVYLRRDKVVA